VRREGKEYEQRYCRGVPKSNVKVVSKSASGHGTSILFPAGPGNIPSIEFSGETIRERCALSLS